MSQVPAGAGGLTRRRMRTRLDRRVVSSLDLQQVLDAITRAAGEIGGVRFVALWTLDAAATTAVAAAVSDDALWTTYPARSQGLDHGIVGAVARSGRAIHVPDVPADPRVVAAEWFRACGFTSYFGQPLVAHGRVVGVLTLSGSAPFDFDADERDEIDHFAAHAGIAITNARLFADSERRRRTAEGLAEVSRVLAQSLDPQVVAGRILDSLGSLLSASWPALFRLEPASGDLVLIAAAAEVRSALGAEARLPAGTGISGCAVTQRAPVATQNLLTDARVRLTAEQRVRMAAAPYRAVLSVPLIHRGEVIGALSVFDAEGRIFGAEDVRLAQALADQAALAVANAELMTDARTRQARLEALVESTRRLSSIQPAETLLDSIAEACGRLLDSRSVGFRLVEGDELVVTGTFGDAGQVMARHRLKTGESLSGVVAISGEPMVVSDIATDARVLPEHRTALARHGYRYWLGVPAKIGAQVIGVLSIRRHSAAFTDADVTVATAFAAQAAVAINNARLYRVQEVRAARLRTLAALGSAVSSSLEPDEVLRRIAAAAADLMDVTVVEIWLADEAARRLQLHVSSSPTVTGDQHRQSVAYGDGGVGWVALHREPLVLAEGDLDDRVADPDWFARHQLRSGIWLPIALQGEFVGVLTLLSQTRLCPGGDDEDLLRSFTAHAAVAIRNARLFAASERRRAGAEALADGNRSLTESLNWEVVVDRIVRRVAAILGARLAAVYSLAADAGELLLLAGVGSDVVWSPRIAVGAGVFGLAVQERRAITTGDALADPAIQPAPAARQRIEESGYRSVLATPLIVHGRIIGALGVGAAMGRAFDDEAVRLLETFADQAALAIENASLYRTVGARLDSLRRLVEVSEAVGSSLDWGQVLRRTVEAARTLVGADVVRTWIVDGEAGVARPGAVAGDATVEIAPAEPPGVPGPTHDDVGASDDTNLGDDGGPVYRLAMPLALGQRTLAMLEVVTRQRRRFTVDERDMLQLLAGKAAIALDQAILYRRAEDRAERLSALSEVTRLIISAADRGEISNAVARAATLLLGARMTQVWTADDADGTLTIAGAFAADGDEAEAQFASVPVGVGVLGAAVASGQAQYLDDVLADPQLSDRRWAAEQGFGASAVIPLVTGEQRLGALAIFFGERRTFTDEDKDLLRLLASQAAIAIDKSRLYESLARKNAHLQELFEIARQVTVSLSLADVLPTLVRAAAGFAGHDAASIRLLDAAGRVLRTVANHGLGGAFVDRDDLRIGEEIAGGVVADGYPLLIEDLARTSPYLHRAAALAEGLRSMAVVPLRLRDQVIGTLSVYSRSARRYGEGDVEVLARFANVAAVAIGNAQMVEDARARAERMKRLSELNHLVNSSLDVQRVLDFVAAAAGELVKGDRARLWVVDDGTGALRLSAQAPASVAESAAMRTSFEPGEGVVGWVIERRETYYAANVTEDALFVNKAWARASGYVSMLIVPLTASERTVGALAIMTKAPRWFAPEERELLELFAAKAASALENARLYHGVQTQAAELRTKNAELDSFVYSVSHDLKNPLVAIQGLSNLLLEDNAAHLDDRGRRYLDRIGANVLQMERLIGDLLALSRVGREGRPAERVDVDEIVDDVLIELGQRIRARGIEVVGGDLGAVVGVRTQQVQVWTNLLSNAVKYLGATPTPVVEVGRRDGKDGVEFWVKDNGIGIDPAYHGQIFELFQRLKEVDAEGTGVGLPIVKKIIDAAGGRIWVESVKGDGATFRFTWPSS